jgi:2-oxo-4-hydroxy-4-carboxy-5-ureidoimidazoline decarboxylase
VGGRSELSLAGLNELPARAARQVLAGCCAAERWVDAVLAGRPYAAVESLLAESDAAVAAMKKPDLLRALDGHPRIGARLPVSAGRSRREQAGVAADDDELIRALADGNAAYERKFGYVYLVCATGKSGPELLDRLRERLGNEPDREWRVALTELAKINRIRLRDLTSEEAGGGAGPAGAGGIP